MQKRWRVAETVPFESLQIFGEESPLVGQLLWNRGIRSKEQAQTFFEPSWERDVHDPFLFRQMREAIARVVQALANNERITVHGDYDADGITGSTLLLTVLKELKEKSQSDSVLDYYIPHRDKEGYGLNFETVTKLKERGTQLMITVDCGIASVDEIAAARATGMDVIVVDHHQFGERLPDAILIHPGLPGETYPFVKLAAVGVAFKFGCGLLTDARERGLMIATGFEKWLLDLAAIATVTDMVPLVGENRVLLSYGLKVLNKTRRLGLRMLLETAGVEGELDVQTIGFMIGPRLNAAGRMDHAELALRLMLSENEEEARGLARDLERCNRDRQEATKKMMVEAEEKLTEGEMPKVLLFFDERWSPSLVGLLAGKFMDRFARPVAVVGKHEQRWIGSGRSMGAFDITSAVRTAGEGLLTRIGGHIQACGFSLEKDENVLLLRDRLTERGNELLKDEDLIPLIDVDATVSLEQWSWPLLERILGLKPFGEGNRQPVFLAPQCMVVKADTVGQNAAHLRLQLLAKDGRRFKGIMFKAGARLSEVTVGRFLDIVYHVDAHEWNGRRDIECKLLDFRVDAVGS